MSLPKAAVLLLFVTTYAFFLWPLFSLANGGDQRVVDGKYLINLARAPFTPRAGEKISMLISFADIQSDRLIPEELVVKIRIAKLGGIGTAKREFLFERGGLPVAGGVLEFPYTFTQPGLHEIFIDFVLAPNPQKVYEAPDFLLDVQKPIAPERSNQFVLIGATAGMLIGFLLGWFLKRSRFA